MLFGIKALRKIALDKEKRIARILQTFMPDKGCILAFQKNAYEGLRDAEAPVYSITQAREGRLTGSCKFNSGICVIGCPPTRYLNSEWYQILLVKIKKSALQYLKNVR